MSDSSYCLDDLGFEGSKIEMGRVADRPTSTETGPVAACPVSVERTRIADIGVRQTGLAANDPIVDIRAYAYRPAMLRLKHHIAAFSLLAALTMLSACAKPSHDPSKLSQINSESQLLMKAYPATVEASIPKEQWTRVVASIEPDSVLVNSEGVYITTKTYFDGGWGYFTPRKGRSLPEPLDRFEEVGQGVYWWHPY